jgi:hypothetical protein
MTVSGLRPSTALDNRREGQWRNMILRLFPYGSQRAPLAALTAAMKSEATTDAKFHWFTKKSQDFRFKLAETLASGATAGATQSIDIDAGTSAFGLKAGDVLMAEHTGELLYVATTPTTATELSLIRGFELTAGAAVAAVTYNGAGVNPYLRKVGSAYEEGSAAPDPIGYDPEELENQCQIFRETFGLTNTAIATKTRTGDEVRESKQDCLEAFTDSMEMAFWFGKLRTTSRNGQPLRLTDGIFNQLGVDQKISLSSREGKFSLSYWESLMGRIFRWGSQEKMAFCGSTALLAITQMVRRNSQLNWTIGAPTKEYGMDVQRLMTPLGTLVLKHHPMFSQMTSGTNGGSFFAGMENAMAILDMGNLKYRYLTGRDVTYQPNMQLPPRRASNSITPRPICSSPASVRASPTRMTRSSHSSGWGWDTNRWKRWRWGFGPTAICFL